MANAEKFSKTIDDDELDQVAGGVTKEMKKDIQFLCDLKLADANAKDRVTNHDDQALLKKIWEKVEISYIVDNQEQSHYRTKATYDITSLAGWNISRQSAMIYAMRATKKVVDLDNYN